MGHPAPRPALFVGAGWDTVPPPPNPVPWATIARIERRDSIRGAGTALGLLAGCATGAAGSALAFMESDASTATRSLVTLASVVAGGVVGAWLGHGMLDPEPTWKSVYVAEPRP
jgi:hypothetical protein